MGIGFAISFILPFPISLAVLLLVFLLLNAIRTDIALRRQGTGGIRGLYKSLTSFGNNGSRGFAGFGHTPTIFYCMNCGYDHRAQNFLFCVRIIINRTINIVSEKGFVSNGIKSAEPY